MWHVTAINISAETTQAHCYFSGIFYSEITCNLNKHTMCELHQRKVQYGYVITVSTARV